MIPVACYRLISSNLIVIAGYFPLPGQIKQPQTDSSKYVGFRCLYPSGSAFTRPDHGVPANVAYAHHDSNRNVLDEWV